MALASKAHIKLAGHEFFLAEDQPGHYLHNYERLSASRTTVEGDVRQQNLDPDYLKWSYTDWSGGEGNKFYNPDQPTVYYRGQANGRNPGELATPPNRTSGTFATQATPSKIWFVPANGNLYMATSNVPSAAGLKHFAESTDAVSWTGRNAGFDTDDVIKAVASDQTYVYILTHNGTNQKIRRYNPGATSSEFSPTQASTSTVHGLAFLPIAAGGRLYQWTGKRLFEYDTTQEPLPVDRAQVFTTGADTVPGGAGVGIVACENSVVFYLSTEGRSQVWEYGLGASGAAKPLWHPPRGFVIKDMCYSLGVVLFVGNYSGHKALFGLSLVTRQADFLGFIRPTATLVVADMSPSFGSEILILSQGGHLFSYDLALDAYSEIDDATAVAGTWAATTTWKDKRVAAVYSSTTTTSYIWDMDDASLSTVQVSEPEMPAWDYGIPEDNKVLLGFSINTSALSAENRVTISYDLDETGTYTDLDAVTSGGPGNQFIPVTTTPVFNTLRWKVNVHGTARLRGITARAFVLTYLETWDLIIDLRRLPESAPKAGDHALTRIQARQIILAAIEAKNVVQFQDGYPFEKPIGTAWDESTANNAVTAASSGYRAYKVLVQPVTDEIYKDAQGLLRVRLVNVTP